MRSNLEAAIDCALRKILDEQQTARIERAERHLLEMNRLNYADEAISTQSDYIKALLGGYRKSGHDFIMERYRQLHPEEFEEDMENGDHMKTMQQPVYLDSDNRPRFRENAIIRYIVDCADDVVDVWNRGRLDMVKLAGMDFSADDRRQFAQISEENAIVRLIVGNLAQIVARGEPHAGRLDLNKLAVMNFPQEDREQFAQLMGYSIDGYHELSYVSDRSANEASKLAKALDPKAGGCRDKGCAIHGGRGS